LVEVIQAGQVQDAHVLVRNLTAGGASYSDQLELLGRGQAFQQGTLFVLDIILVCLIGYAFFQVIEDDFLGYFLASLQLVVLSVIISQSAGFFAVMGREI
jgi:hypothetical protein